MNAGDIHHNKQLYLSFDMIRNILCSKLKHTINFYPNPLSNFVDIVCLWLYKYPITYSIGFTSCNGDVERVPWGVFVAADWWVRVLGSSSFIDRPSEYMSVRTIPLSECTDRCSHYIPFSSQEWLNCHRKKSSYLPSFNNYPLTIDPCGICQGPKTFQTTELPVKSPRVKQYPTITERLIT